MTPEDIAADRAVIDAATTGEWVADHMLVISTRAGRWSPMKYDGHRVGPDAAFIAAARPGWPRALDALEAAQAEVERLGAMVEWLAEVIVDARDACQRAESIEPSGSPEWVESGIAMRTTVLREVRAILDRERTAHPSALDKVTAERDEAIRHKVELDDLRRQAKAERDEARAEAEAMRRGEVDGIFTSVVHECCGRAEKAETEVAALRERVADLEGQLAMRGTP